MDMKSNVKKLTYTALLTALAIIIPTYFGFLSVKIPPFTATLASHVPMFLSMFLGPAAAAMVGVGSTIGFMVTAPTVVVFRASTHIIVGLVGALLLKRGTSYKKVVALTGPIHGILEGLVIIPITGFTSFCYIVALGTFIHHFADGIIAHVLMKALSKTGKAAFIQKI
jgi:niacin transporter